MDKKQFEHLLKNKELDNYKAVAMDNILPDILRHIEKRLTVIEKFVKLPEEKETVTKGKGTKNVK